MEVTDRVRRRTQEERSSDTRRRLLASARALFAERGYGATSLADVVDAAGLTKGAVYHHFSNKQDVFRAVYEGEQRHLVRVVADAALREADPWDGFMAGWRAFLEAAQDPAVQRITLLDAPAALGWQRMREIGSGRPRRARRATQARDRLGLPPRARRDRARACDGRRRRRRAARGSAGTTALRCH